MLVIRLQRTGRENTPTYRIVVSEKTLSAKKGCLENVGYYLPAGEKPVTELKKERILHWISMGAQPSNTVARILKRSGVDNMDKFLVRYTKRRSKKEPPEAPAAPAAAPAPAPAPETAPQA